MGVPIGVEGLSPRVRGSLKKAPFLRPWLGPIPACAGEPRGWGCQSFLTRAYPRVCGGADAEALRKRVSEGLSPRVRGSLKRLAYQHGMVGPIPACAGEPITGSLFSSRNRAYPRVCGGADQPCPALCDQKGLSPRVRGSRQEVP